MVASFAVQENEPLLDTQGNLENSIGGLVAFELQ